MCYFEVGTGRGYLLFLDNEYYFGRDGYYGYDDEAERFAFCKAIIEFLPVVDFKPDIIHCNDWQTGVVSILLNAHYKHLEFYQNIKPSIQYIILNIKGFPKRSVRRIIRTFVEYFTADGIEFYDKVNYLKAGVAYSDIINTVSKTYAEEIKTDFYGENLNSILNARSQDLYGILNGIDMERNDPATDERIFENFSKDNMEGKLVNRHMLQKQLDLTKELIYPL